MSTFLTSLLLGALAHVLLVAHAQLVRAQAPTGTTPVFHCGRASQECVNQGICDEATGACRCQNGFGGFDCSARTSTVVSGASCHNECKNGGFCTIKPINGTDGSSANETETGCLCLPEFYGITCDTPRVSHKCLPGAMEIQIIPFTNQDKMFQGQVYVANNEHDMECVFKPIEIAYSDGMKVTRKFRKTLPFNSCSKASQQFKDDGDMEKSFKVMVQHSNMLLRHHDEQITFTCLIRKSGSTTSIRETLTSYERPQQISKKVMGEVFQPVTVKITDAAGNPVNGPIELGTKMQMKFSMNAGQLYDTFRVDSITATNGFPKSDPKHLETKLVQDGCVTKEAKGVVTGFMSNQPSEVKLDFSLFKFLFSSELSFDTVVKTCNGGDGECNKTDCTDFQGVGRKKRAVESRVNNNDENEANYKHFHTSITVLPTLKHNRNFVSVERFLTKDDSTSQFYGCITSPAFIVVVTILSALLVLVLIALAVCCVRVMHYNYFDVNGKKDTC